MKRWIKALLRSANAELVRYRSEEQAMLAAHQRFGIRDLRVLEVFGAHGQISVDESRFLGELVRQSDRTRPIIEVGTLFGHSARVIAMNKDRTQELITVDNMIGADFLAPKPGLIVHGVEDAYCSPAGAREAYERMGGPKRIVWLDCTLHVDLYDNDRYVTQAVQAAAGFLGEHLGAR